MLEEFPAPLNTTRNAATHRNLPIYWLRRPSLSRSGEYAWDSEGFRQATFFLLRTVKAATTYLVCAVAVKEGRGMSSRKTDLSHSFHMEMGISDQLMKGKQRRR